MIPLYVLRKTIWLMERATSTPNWNLPMNRSDFKIYRSVWNELEFVIRNSDRKPINLSNILPSIIIKDDENNKILYNGPLIILNADKGIAKLNLNPNQTTDWPRGFLSYCVTIKNPDGTEKLLFQDTNQRAEGYIEVDDSIELPIRGSLEMLGGTFTPVTTGGVTSMLRYYSGALPGASQNGSTHGLHTMAIYMTNFSGKLWIEGSLESSPTQSNNDWFTICLGGSTDYLQCNDKTGIEAFNFTTSALWIRFYYEPSNTLGTIDKVLFKN